MRICLDVRYKMASGASSYIKNVVPRMMEQAPWHDYFLLKYADQSFDFEDQAAGIFTPPGRSDLLHLAWVSLVLPRIVRRHGIDIYHAMKMPGPSWTGARTVTTMHSIFDPYKGSFPVDLKTRLFLTLFGGPMVRRSDRLVAVSDFIRDCLIERYGIEESRIDVVYNGIDTRFTVGTPSEIAAFKQDQGLPDHYVLCVGNVTPVKNHLTAVRAFADADLPPNVHLLLAGGTTDAYAVKVVMEARSLGIEDRVKLLGFVAPEDLPLLMGGARILLFPSLTEGCPVTMLEAFGCGLPIVASKRGGLWDLGKEIALFVEDPMDSRSFAETLTRLWSDEGQLSECRRRGLEAAEGFSWDRAASGHLRCYEKLGDRRIADRAP